MSPRLLLVDDAEDIRAIACMSLERLGGWSVVPVASGAAALQAARRDGPFDAVLLDVMMPGMDGPSTLARLRADGLPTEVPVIFLTAKTQAADRERLASLGATGVITKPFDPLTLAAQLGELLERAPPRAPI
jgi:CheY-like chemotaxis protein